MGLQVGLYTSLTAVQHEASLNMITALSTLSCLADIEHHDLTAAEGEKSVALATSLP